MSLLRFVARSLFASYYISEGVKAVRKPAELAPDAERFTSTVAPLVQRVVPADMSSYVPEKAETWVRVSGIAQILGGAMFATGIGRRLGALLLAKGSVLNLAMSLPDKDAPKLVRDAARSDVLRNAAMLGAAVLATQDLQGKPGLSWRAEQAAKVADKKASAISDDVSKSAKRAAKKTRKATKKLGKKLESITAS
ncbi:MAG TPA: DoxX family membrane protein [Tessaracoccus flavescens]|uniref:DoxX family membrane protein n=1 Tax=Tessaracoccus flavescens TaxID=399497 RepID=A0A921EME8_9ACTN|nr:DoxX family membrane protein [Tessaracoccus flavescens]